MHAMFFFCVIYENLFFHQNIQLILEYAVVSIISHFSDKNHYRTYRENCPFLYFFYF